MGESGNAGMVPVKFLALSQALLKAAGSMAQAGLEPSVPVGCRCWEGVGCFQITRSEGKWD